MRFQDSSFAITEPLDFIAAMPHLQELQLGAGTLAEVEQACARARFCIADGCVCVCVVCVCNLQQPHARLARVCTHTTRPCCDRGLRGWSAGCSRLGGRSCARALRASTLTTCQTHMKHQGLPRAWDPLSQFHIGVAAAQLELAWAGRPDKPNVCFGMFA